MRRATKNFILLVVGLIAIGLFCEFFVYYSVIVQCSWPYLEARKENVLKTLILADTHLLGPFRGHWLDKLRREWQMHQAFQAIIKLHRPEVVFVLGDLFDEGEWTDNQQFQEYVERFYKLFLLPDNIKMFIVVGNHDIGFHNHITQEVAFRFSKLLKAPSVQHVILKGNHFILLNSMALHGDSCWLCTEARKQIEEVSEMLSKCSKDVNQCCRENQTFGYSRPILMQHFPLYRISDAICTEPDAPPLPERNKLFKIRKDALSKESTNYIVSKFKPRVAFGGHTHHGCLVQHSYKNLDKLTFLEYSVPSFSWRNRPDPKYMLLHGSWSRRYCRGAGCQVAMSRAVSNYPPSCSFSGYFTDCSTHYTNNVTFFFGCAMPICLAYVVSISPTEYAVNKCELPTEIMIFLSPILLFTMLVVFLSTNGILRR